MPTSGPPYETMRRSFTDDRASARTNAIGLRRDPPPPMPTVMPSCTSATMSSMVTRLSGTRSKVSPGRTERQIVHSASVDISFDGRTVLVTGGCRGVGRGIAQRFADAGANVVICCRHEPSSLPDGWLFVAADVREPDQVDEVVEQTRDRFGALDVLVNNAGGSPPADSATASPRFTAGIIALNLTA